MYGKFKYKHRSNFLSFLIPPNVFSESDLNLAASLPVGSSDSFSAASRAAMRAAFFFKQTEQNVPLVKLHTFAQWASTVDM
jgi:hypothetical protein